MVALESLKYKRGSLQVIDQLKLPGELVFIEIKSTEDTWKVIKLMQVRGAPLIAIVAALGLAVHVYNSRDEYKSVDSVSDFLLKQMEYLRTSRPTAVNLFLATDDLAHLVNTLKVATNASVSSIVDGFIAAAEKMLVDDVVTNKSIGDHGAKRILEIVGHKPLRVLTICNTGSLATAGYGTALGVVRSLHALGCLEQVYACETRPYNQGARLTAFEIVSDQLPGTLITDSMASYLMATKGVDVVFVGADRVAANGDTANKIGTYQLAIVAKFHGVPFFPAVPTTTLDLSIPSGAKIHVEERPADELTTIFGHKIAPDGINVWNPSFDVTPCSLIRGVITEVGVAEATGDAGGIIDMTAFLKSKGLERLCSKSVAPVEMPIGYKSFTESTVAEYILTLSSVSKLLGGSVAEVKEVGDGNLNFVYILTGGNGFKVVVKQALPYVRCVGESWPLTLERAYFERNALVEERKHVPEYVPEVYHFEKSKSLMVMRFIEPPHLILRKYLIEGVHISTFAVHVAKFSAKTLFHTSLLGLEGGAFRNLVSEWSRNTAMCALTEGVIFTDPYRVSPFNHWTTPQLDAYAEGLRNDSVLKSVVTNMKEKFLGHAQALLHGDLHTGSVMAHEGSTFVIDPEFAFMGPIGFDIGAFLANLFLNYFSHASRGAQGKAYSEWILKQVIIFHNTFETQLTNLWCEARKRGVKSEQFPADVYNSDQLFALAQAMYLRGLYSDTLGFMALKMIRRVVGIAHVADLESIADADQRAACEKRVLNFARKIAIASQDPIKLLEFQTLDKVVDFARNWFVAPSPATWDM